MTTTPTTPHLLQLLAKMLPERLTFYTNPSTQLSILLWKNHSPRFVEAVKPTELLDICRQIEEGLSPAQRMQFAQELYDKTTAHNSMFDYSGCYYEGDSPSIDTDVLFTVVHASYENRTIALAKVKGIEV